MEEKNAEFVQHLSKVQHVDDRELEIHERVWSCAWHHTGGLLASSGEDKTIKIWKCSAENDATDDECTSSSLSPLSLKPFCTIRGDQNRSIRWVCFSPCGRFLAAASFDASIIVYERNGTTGAFEEVHKLEGHECEVKGCSFSVSGHYLATCSRDKSVWVWKADEDEDGNDDYEVLSILQQHTADVKFVVWHPLEDVLLSGGYDCSLRFYNFDGDDWVTAQEIKDAHTETIWSAAFEPVFGLHLATVGADQAIKIWTRAKSSVDNQSEEENLKQESWCFWRKAVDLPVLNTRWPLYAVAWSRGRSSAETTISQGVIAAAGGDRLIRFYSYDAENEALISLGTFRLQSEINCLSWRPRPKQENDVNGGDEAEVLAAAVDDGYVCLLQVFGNKSCQERGKKDDEILLESKN